MKALVLALLAGCSLDMSQAQPWVSIDDVSGALVAERAVTGSLRTRREVPANPLRVVTYNLQYAPDPSALASAILSDPELVAAGVVLVQETEAYSAEGSSRTAQLADELGFAHVYVPAREVDGGTHGLAIISAFPIDAVEKMELPEAGNRTQRRIAIQAVLDVAGTPVHVIDVHLDTKLNTTQRIAQLSPVVRDAPATTIVAGDFNMSWVEWVGGSVPVLSSARSSDQAPVLDDYMRHLGFDTPTSESGPTEHMFGLEQRLDAIYTRGHAVRYGGVPRVGPSDHWPLWVDLALR